MLQTLEDQKILVPSPVLDSYMAEPTTKVCALPPVHPSEIAPFRVSSAELMVFGDLEVIHAMLGVVPNGASKDHVVVVTNYDVKKTKKMSKFLWNNYLISI